MAYSRDELWRAMLSFLWSPASRPDFLKFFFLGVLAPILPLWSIPQGSFHLLANGGAKALVVQHLFCKQISSLGFLVMGVLPRWSLVLCLPLAHHSVERDRAILDEEDDARNRPRRRSHVPRPSGLRKRGSQNRVALILAVVNKPWYHEKNKRGNRTTLISIITMNCRVIIISSSHCQTPHRESL